MKHRLLGRERLEVSTIGYGCPTFRGSLGADAERRAIQVLHRAIDLGVTYIDTADHNGGNNEDLLALALCGRRDKVVLATKFGNLRGQPWANGRLVDGRPSYVASACEASLSRLKTDRIDLFYLHRVDPSVPIEDTVGAMQRLVEQGKVRHLGLAEAGADTIRRADAVHPIAAVQSEYSVLTRDYERDVLPACRRLGVGFVAYYPLGRGLLSGGLRSLDALGDKDMRRKNPRFQEENLRLNLALVDAAAELAAQKNCTASQLALAWLLAQGDFIVPIPGTTTLAHLEENVAAAEVALTKSDLERLEAIFAPEAVAGARHEDDRSKELNI